MVPGGDVLSRMTRFPFRRNGTIGVGRRLYVVKVRRSIRPVRGWNSNDERVGLSWRRSNLQLATSDRLLNPGFEPCFFDMDPARTERFDNSLARVNTDHLHAVRREHGGGRQSNIPEAYDAHAIEFLNIRFHGLILHRDIKFGH